MIGMVHNGINFRNIWLVSVVQKSLPSTQSNFLLWLLVSFFKRKTKKEKKNYFASHNGFLRSFYPKTLIPKIDLVFHRCRRLYKTFKTHFTKWIATIELEYYINLFEQRDCKFLTFSTDISSETFSKTHRMYTNKAIKWLKLLFLSKDYRLCFFLYVWMLDFVRLNWILGVMASTLFSAFVDDLNENFRMPHRNEWWWWRRCWRNHWKLSMFKKV